MDSLMCPDPTVLARKKKGKKRKDDTPHPPSTPRPPPTPELPEATPSSPALSARSFSIDKGPTAHECEELVEGLDTIVEILAQWRDMHWDDERDQMHISRSVSGLLMACTTFG
jgi:hypothetical protein